MFQAPLCSLSGPHDDSVGYHIGRLVLEFLLDGSYRHELLMMGIMVPETC